MYVSQIRLCRSFAFVTISKIHRIDNLIINIDFLFEHEFLVDQFFIEFVCVCFVVFHYYRFEASHKFGDVDNKTCQ